jgi:hypothetical protein
VDFATPQAEVMLSREMELATPQAEIVLSRVVENITQQAGFLLSQVVVIATPQAELRLLRVVDISTSTMAYVQVLFLVNATILADLLIHLLQVAVYVQTELVQPL